MKRIPYKTQQAAQAGDVIIMEVDEEISQADLEQQATAARMSATLSLEQDNIKIAYSKKKAQAMKEIKAKEEQVLIPIDIADTIAKMKPRTWYMMQVIGTTGICESSELFEYIEQHYPDKNDPWTKNGMAFELKNLVGCGFISQTSAQHPLKPNFSVYYLSSIGRRAYLEHFGQDPCLSERDVLTSQHDNYEHGVGIKCLKQIILADQNFASACMERKQNTCKLKDGTTYIPDIIAKGITSRGGQYTAYFEYERGTHSQNDFSVKLMRMAQLTRYLNIVCPNVDAVNACQRKTEKWLESRNYKVGALTIRITTLKRLKECDNINKDDNWAVVFRLAESRTPIIH